MNSALLRDEIEEAIRTLPSAGWVRLRQIARWYCRGGPLESDDLLQQAFERTLNGSRHCPASVDIVTFFAGVMQSIASDAAKGWRRHPERQTVSLMDDAVGVALDPPECRPNAEQELVGRQETAHINKAIVDLFGDDLVAQVLVEGMMEGMEGEELRATTGLGRTGFASKRRLVRRRIETAYPDGWKP